MTEICYFIETGKLPTQGDTSAFTASKTIGEVIFIIYSTLTFSFPFIYFNKKMTIRIYYIYFDITNFIQKL